MSSAETGRLARAVAVVGYESDRLNDAVDFNNNDNDDDRAVIINPSILFLYPNEDGDETLSVLDGVIETCFCRPRGYETVQKPKQPDFHTIRLTDRKSRVSYISILTFYEQTDRQKHGFPCYLPKFLVIISDIQISDLFKSCLRLIYEKMALEGADVDCLNRAIANIVNYKMPPPGLSSQLSLGFGDPLTVHSPSAKSVPKTGLTVYRLVQTLGPENTTKAFFCLLSQLQVTMYSADVSFLTDSCEALLALLYPFEYYFIYAPVQTKLCLERHKTLENPTPFFIGICESPEDVLREVADKVVLIDLDQNLIRLPTSLSDEICDVDKRLACQLVDNIRAVTNSTDYQVDQRSGLAEINLSRSNLIEKRLRACFLKFHASLICDYRQSLSAVRIHPKPRIFFDKAHFFGRRRLRYQSQDGPRCTFLSNFVDIFLEQILKDRKLPVREADFFDELCALLCGMTGEMIDSIQLVDDIAKYLLENDKLAVSENCPPNVVARYLACQRTCPFPAPNRARIAKFSYEMNYEVTHYTDSMVVISPVKSNTNNSSNGSSNSSPTAAAPPTSLRHGRIMAGTRHRNLSACYGSSFFIDQIEDRMAIYCTYIACVFAKELKKAKTLVANVPKAIESESIEVRRRIPLKLQQYCQQLTLVDRKQFWALAQLVYSLLVLESQWDENGIAASLLPVLRNLQMAENKRFLYMTVQTLPVWRNELFWVSVACRHIAGNVAARYENHSEIDLENEPCHSVDVLATILEKEQPGKPSDEVSEEAIALTWCKHFTDLMVAFLVHGDKQSGGGGGSGNDSGISVDDDFLVLGPPVKTNGNHVSAALSVEYHVGYAVEEICKEANLSLAYQEAMKIEVVGKISEHIRYVQSLQLQKHQLHQTRITEPSEKGRRKSLGLVNLIA